MHPSDFTPPEGYTTTYATIKNFPMVYYNGYQWELIDGEPTIEDMPNESEYTIPMPKAQWRIQSSYNDGFPWNELIPDIPYMNTFSHISQGVAEEITDTTTLPYKRVTISGYTNPDLIRFQDKDFEEGDLQKIGIFGLNSYRYIEKQNYTEGSTEVEIP